MTEDDELVVTVVVVGDQSFKPITAIVCDDDGEYDQLAQLLTAALPQKDKEDSDVKTNRPDR